MTSSVQQSQASGAAISTPLRRRFVLLLPVVSTPKHRRLGSMQTHTLYRLGGVSFLWSALRRNTHWGHTCGCHRLVLQQAQGRHPHVRPECGCHPDLLTPHTAPRHPGWHPFPPRRPSYLADTAAVAAVAGAVIVVPQPLPSLLPSLLTSLLPVTGAAVTAAITAAAPGSPNVVNEQCRPLQLLPPHQSIQHVNRCGHTACPIKVGAGGQGRGRQGGW
jgi:hypothetical protein